MCTTNKDSKDSQNSCILLTLSFCTERNSATLQMVGSPALQVTCGQTVVWFIGNQSSDLTSPAEETDKLDDVFYQQGLLQSSNSWGCSAGSFKRKRVRTFILLGQEMWEREIMNTIEINQGNEMCVCVCVRVQQHIIQNSWEKKNEAISREFQVSTWQSQLLQKIENHKYFCKYM